MWGFCFLLLYGVCNGMGFGIWMCGYVGKLVCLRLLGVEVVLCFWIVTTKNDYSISAATARGGIFCV